ncbi:glycosyltransferase [Capnocytophaga felis]|uniref:Glycosyl transferase n=1 Tax=Capnocytophaga felis TaxID=2267611 RepID=A0A5M4BCQ9_9FLAO|nr:glycosyltransferase [Capnocytophaga felis]GET47132.1 hypothetical protein RCZ01_24340 [Capnocytophaga felis]GET49641.1 hypothetical protein RCZ02_24720 [Capnocytophaga felis]
MSYQIFIIDYYEKELFKTGVNAYVKNISKNHTTNFIWLEAPFLKITKILSRQGGVDIFVPFDIISKKESQELEIEAINSIVKYIDETYKNKIIIFHFNWLHHSIIASSLCQKIPCVTLLTCHYIYFRDLITENYREFHKINQFLLQNRKIPFLFKNIIAKEFLLYQKFDHIITVTDDAQNVLHQLFEIPQGKITTIPNGIDLQEINTTQTKRQLRRKHHFSEDEKIILFAGRITQMKGVVELIQAFEKLSLKDDTQKYRLVICGKGDYDWVYKKIHCYSQITLTGNLSKEQLYEFYALADVGVIPSYAEQCSYTAIEMMASWLPVVVTDVGGLNELIDSENGLKTHIEFTLKKIQFNTDDLAEKIHQSLTNPQLAKKRAEKAFQKVLSELTAEKMAEQTLQVYEKLLKQPEDTLIIDQTELVSVVIPCYNAEKYIERCLLSVLNQSYQNFDILLIDDASEDKTLKIISKFNDNRLKIFRNATNKGIVYALNKDISEAKGNYIARLDSDDLMQPNRIAQQISFLRENPEYVMVGSSHILIDEQENILQYIAYPETNEVKTIIFAPFY